MREKAILADLPDLILHRLPERMHASAVDSYRILWRVVAGVYNDGFIHAGNLAYLALVTLFPFFIVAAAIASALGATEQGQQSVAALLDAMPPSVQSVLAGPIHDVIAARSGSLLWLGAIVGLWTTGSFIETIRDILNRAYGIRPEGSFLSYRLGSVGLTIAAVLLMMTAFSLQFFAFGLEEAVARYWPRAAHEISDIIATTKLVPAVVLYGALWVLFYILTPARYRRSPYRKWPGALATTLWWVGVTAMLPWMLGLTGGYDKTYGSLAGVMVALIFFYFAGFGIVIGAELNAALAMLPFSALKEVSQRTNNAEGEA